MRRLAAGGSVTRLVLGAAKTSFGGWVSTDISPRAQYYLDATKPWPSFVGSLSYIYADNMIEHVTLDGARATLANAFIALKSGGKIRLVTPDIGRTAEVYLKPGEVRDAVLKRAKQDDGKPGVYPVDILRLVMTQAGHPLGQALGSEMEKAGFADVMRREMGESPDPILQGLESRENTLAVPSVALIIEATKP